MFEWILDLLRMFPKIFQKIKFMKIRPVEAVLFDAVRHDKAYSHFLKLWERTENIPDETYVKTIPNTLYDSMDLVRFYNRIYQLPLH